MRCMHEASLWPRNVVVTLTYDKEHLPANKSLVKRDLQLYMKKLRKRFGKGIRFYACGEYGEQNKRPHYHVIIFNFDFSDKKYYKMSKTGTQLWTSDVAEQVWEKGFCVLGEVTFETAAYIARYVVDKMTGPKAEEWYTYVTPDGEVITVEPEFTNMSRKPGIGRGYFDKFGAEVYQHDSVIMNAKEVRPPRYYDTLKDAIDPKRMEVLKRKRRREALKHQDDNTSERRRVKEQVQILALNMWKRNVS